MGLTDIGQQLTPGNPTEITFAPQTTPPGVSNGIALIGHQSLNSGSASGASYKPIQIVNVSDPVAASGEAAGYFGAGSEMAAMVVAAVKANQLTGTTFPPITAIPLASADVDWGQALPALDKLPGIIYAAGCYDAMSNTLALALLAETQAMSLPQRVDNGQFGTMAILANQSTTNPTALTKYNQIYGEFQWFRNTAPTQLNGEIAASCAAILAANQAPFNPVKNVVLPNIVQPASAADPIQVGGSSESEIALQAGWSPLRVLPNGSVAFLRSRTLRIFLADGVTPVTAYFDDQDFRVLFYWRQTLVTRFNQVDFANTKNSPLTRQQMLAEMIRLGELFQTNGMFQGMAQAAKAFAVQQNATDRSRADALTPVDVIPILAVIATNIQATTAFDTLTV